MFYKLKKCYVLRGWEKMPWILVQRPNNKTIVLNQEDFQVLLLCDGETNLENTEWNLPVKKILRKLEDKEYIEKCENPSPIDSDQNYQYYKNRHVQSIIWSITGKCNFRCRHCYMDAPDQTFEELSTEEAFKLIDQMNECGILRVDLTGGEPFVRKDFWQLVDRILSYKITIGMIYTNGWLLNETVLNEFERRNIKPEFSISFDGVGWHDWMRGIPGAEKAALRALQLCKEHGFYTNIEMCIHRGNQNALAQTIDTLREVGVYRIKTASVMPTDLWRNHSDGNAFTKQEYMEAMIRYIPQYYKSGRPLKVMLSSVIYLDPEKPYDILPESYDGTEKCLNCNLCESARWTCYITPEGRLLPCMPMTSRPEQSLFPKVQDIGLKRGLKDSFYMKFIDTRIKDLLAVNQECASCEYRFKCGGGCRANALLEGDHDLMGCDRSMCMIWKNGYVQRIRETADAAIEKYEKNSTSYEF